VAHLLCGAWRDTPERRDAPFGLSSLAELLILSGTAPLAWHVLRSGGECTERLHEVWRMSAIRASLSRQRAAAATSFFRSHGIESLLIRGLAIARMYPEEALRPYTDTDLVFGPGELEEARRLIGELPEDCGPVTLHGMPEEWKDREWDDLVARGVRERGDEGNILFPSPEDHLRLLAIHAMKRGVARPLWLCDLGLAVESRDENFDWSTFSSGNRWLTRCALAAIKLAGSLLGANLDGTPAAAMPSLPWMEDAVLKAWSDPYRWPDGEIAGVLKSHPLSLGRELTRRWPGAVEASYNLRAPWNRLPRFPFQFADLMRRLPLSVAG
jgi:hypothetical protein